MQGVKVTQEAVTLTWWIWQEVSGPTQQVLRGIG